MLPRLLLRNSHQPMQNWADSRTTKIHVNPTPVSKQMHLPVQLALQLVISKVEGKIRCENNSRLIQIDNSPWMVIHIFSGGLSSSFLALRDNMGFVKDICVDKNSHSSSDGGGPVSKADDSGSDLTPNSGLDSAPASKPDNVLRGQP